MRLDNTNFISKSAAATKRPLYALQVSADLANTDTFWLTSSSLCEVPDGATVIHSVIEDISGTTQRLDPINAVASIGSINFSAVDNAQAVTNIIKTKLDAGDGLRHKRVRVYVGYEGLAWDDYALIQTQIIRNISLDIITYEFSCSDIQRTARKNIFDNKETNLKYAIDDAQTAIAVYNTSDFSTVFHGTSYTDSPSTTVGYIKTEKEIIRWLSKLETAISETGIDISFSGNVISSTTTDLSVFSDEQVIRLSGTGGGGQNDGERFITGTPTANSITVTGAAFITEAASANINILAEIQFYNITRGALNTKAVIHEVDITADSDKRTEVTEHIYLELPAVKLLYAVLTGILYGDGATLPDHWHLNISTDYVATSTFTGIGTDWWDTTDDLAGFPSRFNGMEKEDGKRFYEKELLLLLGAYLPVLSDGQLALRRMNRTLADSPYVAVLDETNVVRHGSLKHDMGAVHNQFKIRWNWDVTQRKLTRSYLLVDAGSVSVHGAADVMQMSFRGLDGTNHTQAALAMRTDSARDRYTGPPLVTEMECLHHMNKYEVGDIVRDRVPGIKDFITGLDIDRSMEIQQARINWITGQVVFSLFGSSRAADAQSATSLGTVLSNSYYGAGSGGTDISTVTTGSDIGGVWHISTNSILTGGTDMNAAGSIFYYEGGVQIDPAITLTINNNVQIRARDGLVCNGNVDGFGNGIVRSPDGTSGMFNTKSTGGMNATLYEGTQAYESFERDTVQGTSLNYYTLDNGDTTLVGIPTEMRGSSGADGGDVNATYHPDYDSETSSFDGPIVEAVANGGLGGDGGAGLCVVARGFSCGVAANIDLGGTDGSIGAAGLVVAGVRVHPGAGSGGAPGGLLILLDGATANESGVASAFTASSGALNDTGVRHIEPLANIGGIAAEYTYFRDVHSYYEGFIQQDLGGAAYRVQYIPANETPQEDVPQETSIATSITIQEVSTSLANVNTTSLEINVTPPSDGNYYSSRIMVAVNGTDGWFDLGIVLNTDEVVFPNASPGVTYAIRAYPISIEGVQSEDYQSNTWTVSSTIEAVIGTGNALVTQTDPATNGGVIVESGGITGYDSGGNSQVTINATTGYITAIGGTIGGWALASNTLSSAGLTIESGASPNIRAGQSAYDAGAGFWIGSDAGTWKFSLGNSAGDKLLWDGSNLNITGAITADSGEIGGWNISSTTIISDNNRVILDSANERIQVQSVAGTSYVRMDANGLVGVDSILGTVFNIPTDGSAPTFASGIINSTVFNITSAGILETSSTAGDGSGSGQGVRIDNAGIQGWAASDATAKFKLDATNGQITAMDAVLTGNGIVLNAGGALKSTGKTVGSGTGIFLGYDSGSYQLDVGDHTNEKYMYFDGTDLILGKNTILDGADAYDNDSIYYHDWFSSLDAYNQYESGDCTILYTSDIAGFQGAGTVVGSCVLQKGLLRSITDATWNKNRKFKVPIWLSGNFDSTFYRMGLGRYSSVYVGFELDGLDLWGINDDGTTQTRTDLSTTLSTSTDYLLEFIFLAGDEVGFYVDGVLKGTSTTNLPSGTTDAQYIQFLLNKSASGTGEISSMQFHEFKFLQDR